LNLVVRRTIRATPERLFDAWTSADLLRRWWGPKDVICVDAEVDLKVGGQYRIGNRFPDGHIVWIAGEFEAIERPYRLVFSWRTEDSAPPERVTVRFEARDDATEVTIMHERIESERLREGHERGWHGCLEGLAAFV
jgi:uncharacterized protein YndB with AHSA1/START domain